MGVCEAGDEYLRSSPSSPIEVQLGYTRDQGAANGQADPDHKAGSQCAVWDVSFVFPSRYLARLIQTWYRYEIDLLENPLACHASIQLL